MSVRITLFGAPKAEAEGKVVTRFRSQRVPALLGFLASRRNSCPRSAAINALWPDAEPSAGRHNLRQTLLYTRQLLGPSSVLAEGDRLLLAPEVETDRQKWADLVAMLRSNEASPDAAAELMEFAENDFLEGYDEPWLTEERNRLRTGACLTLCSYAERCLPADPAYSLQLAEQVAEIDPLLELATLIKVRALVSLKRGAEAKHEADAYAKLLQNEIALPPSPALAAALQSPGEGKTLATRSEFDSAVETLLQLRAVQEAADFVIASVPYLTNSAQPGRGLTYVDKLVTEAGNRLGVKTIQRLTLARAELLRSAGHTLEALSVAEGLILQAKDPLVYVRARLLASRLDLRLMRSEPAERHLTEAAKKASELGLNRELQQAYSYASEVALQEQDFRKSELLAMRAVALCREFGDARTESYVWSSVAQALARQGKSIEPALKGIARCEKALSEIVPPLGSLDRLNITRIREELEDIEGAREGYEYWTNAARQAGDTFAVAIGLTYIGDILERLGRPADAIPAHLEAKELRGPLGDLLGMACSYRGLGRAYLALQNLEEARSALVQSAQLFQEQRDVNGFTSALLLLALVEQAKGEKELAYRTAKRSLDLLAGLPNGASQRMGPTFDEVVDRVRAITASSVSHQ